MVYALMINTIEVSFLGSYTKQKHDDKEIYFEQISGRGLKGLCLLVIKDVSFLLP